MGWIRLLCVVLVVVLAAPGAVSTLRAQEQATDTEVAPKKPPASTGSDTSSILADLDQGKDVSTDRLRHLRVPDELLRTVTSDLHADLRFMNRRITRFRAQVMGDLPAMRAKNGAERIERLVETRRIGPVDAVYIDQGVLIRVGKTTIFAIADADLDVIGGETIESRAEEAIENLELVMQEAQAMRQPRQVLHGLLSSAGITLIYAFWIWLLVRLGRLFERKTMKLTGKTLKRSIAGSIAGESRQKVKILKYARKAVQVIGWVLISISTYLWLAALLRSFPYTRPWGEALGDYLLSIVAWIGQGIVTAIPGFFVVTVIYWLTRFLTRLVSLTFGAVAEGRLSLPGLHPETAQPTRKLITVGLWLLAIVVAYPYIPGSSTDAFKGLSVFVGLVVSLGSTGVVNQATSGLMLMYSRALRVGDWVLVGEVEGEVLELGMLSTKIRTRAGEEVTVPNAVVISKETVNYTRFAEQGVRIDTTVTIGYDAPWRQVHALLEEAAARTPGLRREPPPAVMQTSLSDFYPEYRLVATIDEPPNRPRVLSVLHANIQDLFNEYGVQIMSPHYEADPPQPILVPPERRNPPPARPEDPVNDEAEQPSEG